MSMNEHFAKKEISYLIEKKIAEKRKWISSSRKKLLKKETEWINVEKSKK